MEEVHIVRCASHTLALAVDDCLGRKADENTKKLIEKARNVVCTLRNSSMRKELRKKNLPMPVIDVETRWGSTYGMIKRLIELSGFCQEYESPNEKLKLTVLQWQRLQEMAETLAPVRLLTNQLQSSQLTPGQILGHWNLAFHSLKSHETELSEKLIERMTLREEALLSPPVLAGTYLDPEYQVFSLSLKKKLPRLSCNQFIIGLFCLIQRSQHQAVIVVKVAELEFQSTRLEVKLVKLVCHLCKKCCKQSKKEKLRFPTHQVQCKLLD